MARGRTYLAIIRTGLAFFVLTLFRYFGLSLWTIFDAALVVVSGLLIGYGVKGYRDSVVGDRRCTENLASDAGLLDLLCRSGARDQHALVIGLSIRTC